LRNVLLLLSIVVGKSSEHLEEKRMAKAFDVAAVRKHFPALGQKQVYFDNAGGSQILQEVVDAYVARSCHRIGLRFSI